jgi:hypothetical protein
MREILPKNYDFFPVTYTLPYEYKYFDIDTREIKNNHRTYILKAYVNRQETDLLLTRNLRDIKSTDHNLV